MILDKRLLFSGWDESTSIFEVLLDLVGVRRRKVMVPMPFMGVYTDLKGKKVSTENII